MNFHDEFFYQILDQVNDGIYIVDLERRITYWNKGAEEISGFTDQEVLGRTCFNNVLMHTDADGRNLCKDGCPLQGCMVDGERHQADIFLRHKSGVRIPISIHAVPLRDESGAVIGAVEVFADKRPVRHLEETIEELSSEAYLDPLSGALNRRSIEEMLEKRWDQFREGGRMMGVIFVDMDDLKSVNDSYGHMAGDQAILHLCATLQNATRSRDMVGRWGGDEFMVLAEVDSLENLDAMAEKLAAILTDSSVQFRDQRFSVTASFGTAMFPEVGSVEQLIELADQRMYASK